MLASSADANLAMAEELGLTAIRCYVGTEYDGRYDTSFYGTAFVVDGWFEALVEAPEGVRVVSFIWFPDGTDTMEGLRNMRSERSFQVRWSATEGASEAACTHEPVARSTLVVDAELDMSEAEAEMLGLTGVRVDLCGQHAGSSTTLPLRVEVDTAITESGCQLRAHLYRRYGVTQVAPLRPDEERFVHVRIGELAEDETAETEADLEHAARHWEAEAAAVGAVAERAPEGSAARRRLDQFTRWRRERAGEIYDRIVERRDAENAASE